MATTRYSNQQQESKSRQNPRFEHPTTSKTYRRQDDVFGYKLEFLLSGVLPVFQDLNYKLQRRLLDVLPIRQSRQKSFETLFKLFIGGLHEDKLCDTLRGMAPTNVTRVHQTCLFHTERNHYRLGVLSFTHGYGVLSNEAEKSRSDQFLSTSLSFSSHMSCRNKGN